MADYDHNNRSTGMTNGESIQVLSTKTTEEPVQPRTFQACTQCRSRKLKCVMDATDGVCGPPCKRCRRESKPCTLPPAKRKRYFLDNSPASTPAKRYQVQQSIEGPSRTTTQGSPQRPFAAGVAHSARVKPAPTQGTSKRPVKTQSHPSSPKVHDSGSADDGYIMTTAAPWALDFLPVTFCGIIANLSQAYDYHSPSAPSEATSPPSTADGDERHDVERETWSENEQEAPLQTVAFADTQKKTTTSQELTSGGLCSYPTITVGRPQAQPDVSFEKDLGLDDFFNYVRFG